MKVAIVEDDINMRKSLEMALSDDYEIVTFRNAIDALKKLEKQALGNVNKRLVNVLKKEQKKKVTLLLR